MFGLRPVKLDKTKPNFFSTCETCLYLTPLGVNHSPSPVNHQTLVTWDAITLGDSNSQECGQTRCTLLSHRNHWNVSQVVRSHHTRESIESFTANPLSPHDVRVCFVFSPERTPGTWKHLPNLNSFGSNNYFGIGH